MRVDSFSYDRRAGWSCPSFPDVDSESTLVLVFGAPSFFGEPSAIEALTKAYPRATVAGCSSAGEIHGTEILDDSLSVAVVRFDKTQLRMTSVSVDGAIGSFDAGRQIASSLADPGLRAIFILSDGISVNGSELLRGVHAITSRKVIVTGGLAGDGSRFLQTWVIVGGLPTGRAVVGVGLYGDALEIGHGSRGGWDVFGPERRVTRSKGNVLYELDGSPALARYKTYLGDRASGLPATALLFPLALRDRANKGKLLLRAILGVDEEEQSMTFAGSVPEGSIVQLMRANLDRLIEGAAEAGRDVGRVSRESVSVAISCVGRRLVLGERAEEEVEVAAEALPRGTKLVGFYSYGEICPFARGEPSDLHNQTMTITTLSEHD
jgi:hypothetical protein